MTTTIGDDRTLSNPEVTKVSGQITRELNKLLDQHMFNGADRVILLLAASHGAATGCGMSDEELVQRAAEIWEMCRNARKPVQRQLDHDVRDLDPRLFTGANRVRKV